MLAFTESELGSMARYQLELLAGTLEYPANEDDRDADLVAIVHERMHWQIENSTATSEGGRGELKNHVS